jgi:hypothetical protein
LDEITEKIQEYSNLLNTLNSSLKQTQSKKNNVNFQQSVIKKLKTTKEMTQKLSVYFEELKLKKKDSEIVIKQKKYLKKEYGELKKLYDEIQSSSDLKELKNLMNVKEQEESKNTKTIERESNEKVLVQIKKPVVDKTMKYFYN